MGVHQPVHQPVHQLYGEALAGGHLFINEATGVNGTVHQCACPLANCTPSGQPGGQPEAAEISHSFALSTIFLLNYKRKKEEGEKRSAKGIRARGWTGGQMSSFLSGETP